MVEERKPGTVEDGQEMLDPCLLDRVARNAETVRDAARRLRRYHRRMSPEEVAALNALMADAIGRLADHVVTGRRISVRLED